MSNPLALLNQQIVSDIDSLADFWKAAAAEPTKGRAPAKRKRGPRRRTKTPPPAANL